MHATTPLETRARHLTLASLLTAYPDAELQGTLGDLGAAAHALPAAHAVAQAIDERGLDALRSRHLELFDRGGDRASLYETEYGRMRGMGKGNTLADLSGFYLAFGVALDGETAHEVGDHIAVELEFYAWLLLKEAALLAHADAEGVAIVQDARRKFLESHLGSFAPAIIARPEVQADPVYSGVFGWCAELVARECAALGVTPPPLDFFSDAELKDEVKCGGFRLPVVQ